MDFPFVVSNGPKVPKDPALRTLIRKQAMKDVALERRKRSQQYRSMQKAQDDDSPRTGSTSSSSSGHSSANSSPTEASSDLVPLQSPPDTYSDWFWNDMHASFLSNIIPNPLSAYEQLCVTHNITLEDLSGLTLFGICSPIVAALQDQKLLNTLLGHKNISYLRFVPSKYGKVSCITAAVDCVLAKAACRTKSKDYVADRHALSLYSKALREVQANVRCENKSRDPDTMCAIMLLCMFELLDSTMEESYQQHIRGLSRIAQYRRAPNFKSEYDIALLYGSLGAIILESILTFEHCHLETKEWQDAIMSYVQESTWLTQRSEVTIRLRLTETRLPGLICDVRDAVADRSIFNAAQVTDLRTRVEAQHQELIDCLEIYRAHLMRVSLLQPPRSELDLRREILGSLIEHLCIVKRLLAILTDQDRLRLEVENEALCLLLEEISKQPGPKHAWLFNSHEHSILEGIRMSRDLWSQDLSSLDTQRQQDARVHIWDEYFKDLSAMTIADLDAQGAYNRMLEFQHG